MSTGRIHSFNVDLVALQASAGEPITNPKTITDSKGVSAFNVADAFEVNGLARSDTALTLTFSWGFGAETSRDLGGGHVIQGGKDAVQYDASETVSVPADNDAGDGVKFGPPYPRGAEFMKVVVSGGATNKLQTQTFQESLKRYIVARVHGIKLV